jgi:putative salt-induced outer membrane protein YdiY
MIQPFVTAALWLAANALSSQPDPVAAQPRDTAGAQAAPAPVAGPVAPEWTGSVTAGVLMTTGNSETRQANVTADAELKREKDRTTLGFLWVYGDNKNDPLTNDSTLVDRKTFGRAKYDYFFAEKTYGYGMATAEGDLLQDISLRWTAGAGAGHQYLDTETWKFGVEAGVSYIDTDYRSPTSTDTEDVAARIATNTAYKMNDTWSFLHTLEAYPSLEETDDFYGRSDARASAVLTKNMLLQLQWVVDYDNTPATGRERVDQRYLVSLGWKF